MVFDAGKANPAASVASLENTRSVRGAGLIRRRVAVGSARIYHRKYLTSAAEGEPRVYPPAAEPQPIRALDFVARWRPDCICKTVEPLHHS
jgi:hypothetical protein